MGGTPGGNRVEQLLTRACKDAAWAEDLIARRSRLADEQGMELSVSERAMLDAPTEAQMRAAIDAIGQRQRREGAPGGSAAPAGPPGAEPERGIRADPPIYASHGIRPDLPPDGSERQSAVRGHSAVVPAAVAVGAVILGAGAIATSCCTAGVRADMPPPPASDPSTESAGEATPEGPAAPSGSRETTPSR